jgi:isopenicillin N synthase-like dioxygenase
VAELPIVDLSDAASAARDIDDACRDTGFFYVVGHNVDEALPRRLEDLSREFFALGDDEKAAIGMERGGAAWRGWFPVGGELTSGRPDRKEGIYFGAEHPHDTRPPPPRRQPVPGEAGRPA